MSALKGTRCGLSTRAGSDTRLGGDGENHVHALSVLNLRICGQWWRGEDGESSSGGGPIPKDQQIHESNFF